MPGGLWFCFLLLLIDETLLIQVTTVRVEQSEQGKLLHQPLRTRFGQSCFSFQLSLTQLLLMSG